MRIVCSLHRYFRYIIVLATVCIMLLPATSEANNALWKKLEKGGLVIVMRHARVSQGANTSPLVRDSACKKERNLSAKGKHAARLLGKRFRQYKIPIEKVLHSPFCRTTETGRIVFAKGRPLKILSLLEILGPKQASEQVKKLNKMIGSFQGKGNLVLVTHAPNISAIAFDRLRYLDFLVLQPKGSQYEELGIIRFAARP